MSNVYDLKGFVSTVCYIHNDKLDCIKSFVDKIIEKIYGIYKRGEIILINDCSDNWSNQELINNLSDIERIRLTIIETDRFCGIDECIIYAIKYSIGDYVIEFESPSGVNIDFVTDNLIAASRQGHDGVIAVPQKEEFAFRFMRRLVSFETGGVFQFRAGMFSRRYVNKVFDININEKQRHIIFSQTGYPLFKVSCIEFKKHDSIVRKKERSNYKRALLVYSKLFYFIVIIQAIIVTTLGLVGIVEYKRQLLDILFVLFAIFVLMDVLYINEYRRTEARNDMYKDKCKGWMIHRV